MAPDAQETKRARQMFDLPKALQTWVYLAERESSIEKMCLLLYQADKIHLERYGRLIYGEKYFAGEDGPLPFYFLSVVSEVFYD